MADFTWMEWFTGVSGEPITATRLPPEGIDAEELMLQHSLETGRSYLIGFTQKQGLGRITYIGSDPTPDLILGVLRSAGTVIPVLSDYPQWANALYKHGKGYVLFIANPTEFNGTAEFSLAENFGELQDWQVENLVSHNSEVVRSREGKLSLYSQSESERRHRPDDLQLES